MAAFAAVLATENVKEGVLADAEIVLRLEGPSDVGFDPAVEQ
jgi:hypothetical protein